MGAHLLRPVHVRALDDASTAPAIAALGRGLAACSAVRPSRSTDEPFLAFLASNLSQSFVGAESAAREARDTGCDDTSLPRREGLRHGATRPPDVVDVRVG